MFTLGSAARHTGKSKSAISRAINSGRLSATRTDNGGWRIDPTELERVYPINGAAAPLLERIATPCETDLLNRLLADREETIRDLRTRLDAAEADRRRTQEQLTAFLGDRRPWWRRWRAGG